VFNYKRRKRETESYVDSRNGKYLSFRLGCPCRRRELL